LALFSYTFECVQALLFVEWKMASGYEADIIL